MTGLIDRLITGMSLVSDEPPWDEGERGLCYFSCYCRCRVKV